MSASPSQVLDLIPEEIKDKIFSQNNRHYRFASTCHAIYYLIEQGNISEDKGRYYKIKNLKVVY